MRVATYVEYLTIGDRSQDDWHAYKFIQAIKGRRVNGYALIPVCGRTVRLEDSNKDDVYSWFAEISARHLSKQKALPPEFCLVPLPSSGIAHSTPCSTKKSGLTWNGPPMRMSWELARHLGAGRNVIADVLRWKEAMKSSRSGGTRDFDDLKRNLQVSQNLRIKDVLLVDDVMTSGAHLRASAQVLRDHGATGVWAVCAGRTVHSSAGNVFRTSVEELL